MVTAITIISILALVAVATWCARMVDQELRGINDDDPQDHTDGIELGNDDSSQ